MTRRPAPVSPPVVLTIAGSDSGGGAGIQADLKTVEACGGFATSAVTSVTAQNTTGVESTHVLPVEEIDAQVEAVLSDFAVSAVKTGMLATADVVDLVTERVRASDAPAVVDPVMVAASGDRLLTRDAESAYEGLVAEATLVTPNADETAVLTGVDPTDEDDAVAAGRELVELGADAALVKGGHLPGENVVDVLVTGDGVETFHHPRVDTDATHGSGCTLSSAIATGLARGESLSEAVGGGIDLLARAVRYNLDVGEGPGAVHHLVETREAAARDSTAEAVQELVDRLVTGGIEPLVPETGTNVVGATPYAERPDEVAAVDGKMTRTLSGAHPNRGVRFGASTRVARVLLAAREADQSLRFAVSYRYDDAVERVLDGRSVAAVTVQHDRANERGDTHEAVTGAVEGVDRSPVAVVDPEAGAAGLVSLLASDADHLVESTHSLLEARD